jgi:hypothetical protein
MRPSGHSIFETVTRRMEGSEWSRGTCLKGFLEGVCAGAQADEVEGVRCGIALSVKTFTGGNGIGFAISLE